MRFSRSLSVGSIIFFALVVLTACKSRSQPEQGSLRWRAAEAKKQGSHEAYIGNFGGDSEEGEMLIVRGVSDALGYDWIVGEPIEEITLTSTSLYRSHEPDSIFTAYRFRVTKRSRPGHNVHPTNSLEQEALRKLPPADDEILVMKSHGNFTIDGVLLKERGSACFSELLPRPYLLGITMDTSRKVGWLTMGCQSIFMLGGDQLTPRAADTPFTNEVRDRYHNSLSAFLNVVDSRPLR